VFLKKKKAVFENFVPGKNCTAPSPLITKYYAYERSNKSNDYLKWVSNTLVAPFSQRSKVNIFFICDKNKRFRMAEKLKTFTKIFLKNLIQ